MKADSQCRGWRLVLPWPRVLQQLLLLSSGGSIMIAIVDPGLFERNYAESVAQKMSGLVILVRVAFRGWSFNQIAGAAMVLPWLLTWNPLILLMLTRAPRSKHSYRYWEGSFGRNWVDICCQSFQRGYVTLQGACSHLPTRDLA